MAPKWYEKVMVLVGLSLFMGSLVTSQAATEVDGRLLPDIEWDTKLEKFQFDQDKFIGQRFSAMCPPAPRGHSLQSDQHDWFPSRFSICEAGFQAGQINQTGGVVTVQLNPGEKGRATSKRTSRTIQVVKEAGSKAGNQVHQDYLPRINWDTKFTATGFAYKQLLGQRFAFNCPAAPSDMRSRRVVGTDSYAFNSMICRAAVHAGQITMDGGYVTVQMDPSQKRLEGSIRNGVETKDGSSGIRSLSFVAP